MSTKKAVPKRVKKIIKIRVPRLKQAEEVKKKLEKLAAFLNKLRWSKGVIEAENHWEFVSDLSAQQNKIVKGIKRKQGVLSDAGLSEWNYEDDEDNHD